MTGTGPSELPGAIGQGIGLHGLSGSEPLGALVAALRDVPVLLVIDNCEHIATACGELAAKLLAGCPRLTILANGRIPFEVDVEKVFAIPPMSREPHGDLGQSDATDLFVDRATGARLELRLHSDQRGGHRQNLPPAGRLAAGHRAGCQLDPCAVAAGPAVPDRSHDGCTRCERRDGRSRPAPQHCTPRDDGWLVPAIQLADEVIRELTTALDARQAGLTGREVEVLQLLALGLGNSEIADRLVLSPRTVQAHLRSIYDKLGVNSRTAAAHAVASLFASQ